MAAYWDSALKFYRTKWVLEGLACEWMVQGLVEQPRAQNWNIHAGIRGKTVDGPPMF